MKKHIEMLETVAFHLGELMDDVVFVGGVTTSCFITDPAVTGVRSTKDVDIVLDITSYSQFDAIGELLLKKGFQHGVSPDAPICRWRIADVFVDVMPTLEDVLGFSNRWYLLGMRKNRIHLLPSGTEIRILAPELFVASKIEAFLGRGKGDFLLSHDIEDIITLIDGRVELVPEIKASENNVQEFIRHYFNEFLQKNEFQTALMGYLPFDRIGQSRFDILVSRIESVLT